MSIVSSWSTPIGRTIRPHVPWNPTMEFKSREKFGADFVAKLDYLNVKVGASVKYALVDERTVTASVIDGADYLVALKTIDWDDLG